jgi:hypothetical protein
MARENDPEGQQGQGGKQDGKKGMPKPELPPAGARDQGIARDERGQKQPRDKKPVQQVSQTNLVRS